MGTKRVGLARTEALLENLKREIVLGVGSSLAGARKKVETVTNSAGAVTTVLTEAVYPSGTLFALELAGTSKSVDLTLPALTAGLEYTFVVQTTAGSGSTLTLSGPGANVQGVIVCDDGTEDGAGTDLVFDATKAIAGTRVHFLCDGVKWNVVGHCLCDLGDVAIS
jgi:hypothetical protein